jgi:hypothetical protein
MPKVDNEWFADLCPRKITISDGRTALNQQMFLGRIGD